MGGSLFWYTSCILLSDSYLTSVCNAKHQGEICEVVMSGKGPVLKVGLLWTGQATAIAMVAGVAYVPLTGMGSPDAHCSL